MNWKNWLIKFFIGASIAAGGILATDYSVYTEDIELRDATYYKPTVEEFQKYYNTIKKFKSQLPPYRRGLWDCEKICELYKAQLKMVFAKANPNADENLAVFVAYIQGYRGGEGHALLTIDFKDIGVRFIDPQDDSEPQGFEYTSMVIR